MCHIFTTIYFYNLLKRSFSFYDMIFKYFSIFFFYEFLECFLISINEVPYVYYLYLPIFSGFFFINFFIYILNVKCLFIFFLISINSDHFFCNLDVLCVKISSQVINKRTIEDFILNLYFSKNIIILISVIKIIGPNKLILLIDQSPTKIRLTYFG